MATWEKVELLTPNFFSSFTGGAAAFDAQDDFAITNTISNGDCIVTFQKPLKDYQWLEIEVQALSSSGELSVVSFFRDMAGLTGPLESFGAQIYGQGITTFVVPYVGILEGFSWSHVFGSIKIHSIRAVSRNAGITLFDDPATVSGTFAGWTPTGVVGQYYKDLASGTVASGSVNFNGLLLDYCYLKIEVDKAFSAATINIRGQVCNSNAQLQEFYFDQLETSPKNITVTAGADIGCRVTVTVKRAKFPTGISAFGSATAVNAQTSGQTNGVPSAIFSLVNVWTALNTFIGGIALAGTGYVHANGSAAPVSYFAQIPASDIAGIGSMALESTANWAPKNNAALTGVPTAPTALAGTNTTQLATTAFVTSAIAAATVGVSQFNGRTGAVTLSLADVNGTVLAGGPLSIGAASWSTEQLQVSAAGSASIAGRSATAVFADSSFFGLAAYATHDGSVFAAGGTINFRAEENWTVSAKGTYIQFCTIIAGTTVLSEKMRLSSAGNLGIGTTPAYKLHVLVADTAVGAVFAAASAYVRIRPYVDATTGGDVCGLNGGGYAPITISGSAIRLMGSGISGLTVSSAGNVGIGFVPLYPLHVRTAADRILLVRSAFSGQDGVTLMSGNDLDNAFKSLTLEGSQIIANLSTTGKFGVGRVPTTYLFEVAGNVWTNNGFRSATGVTNGLNIAQTGISATAAPPTSLEGGTYFNHIDVAENITGNCIASGAFLNALYLSHTLAGTQNSGGRNSFEVRLTKNSVMRSDSTNRNYVAGAFTSEDFVGDGGTLGAELGAVVAINAVGSLRGTATRISNVTAAEFNTYCVAGTSVRYKSGIQVCQMDGDTVAGSAYDAGISLSNISGATPPAGWGVGIMFSAANGRHPVAAAGSLIGTKDAGTVTRGIDFATYGFTDYAIFVQNTSNLAAAKGFYIETRWATDATGRVFTAVCNGAEQFHVDSASDNPIQIRVNSTFRVVQAGAADSAGTGFRTLRIAN